MQDSKNIEINIWGELSKVQSIFASICMALLSIALSWIITYKIDWRFEGVPVNESFFRTTFLFMLGFSCALSSFFTIKNLIASTEYKKENCLIAPIN